MDTKVTAKAIQRLKIGKHDLKLEAAVLQRRAALELDYAAKLREWAMSLRGHIQANDIQDLKEVRKTFMLLANEADSESNKHYKVFGDISKNINGPYNRILRFRDMNYHKEDYGKGCREINFYEEEFQKLLISYQQVNVKFEKWKQRLSELKKSVHGSRPWFLRPSHRAMENQISYTEKKYNLHQHREREERKALLENTTRLFDEMRGQEKKRLTMLISEFRAYLRILRQNHQESFDRKECLKTVESHLDDMHLDEILENWSAENRKAVEDAKEHSDGLVRVKKDVKGFVYENDVAGMSRNKLDEQSPHSSEQSSTDAITYVVEECTCSSPQDKEGIPPGASREDTMLNVEKGDLPIIETSVEMFEMSDADELDGLELCGRPPSLNMRKKTEDLITQPSTLGLQNKGYATAETEDNVVIRPEPEKRGETRTTARVMGQKEDVAWSSPPHPTPLDVIVRQTKSSKDYRVRSVRSNGMTEVACSDQDVRKTRHHTRAALDTLGVGTAVEANHLARPAIQNKPECSLSGRMYRTPQALIAVGDYKATAPTELSFAKGRALTMLVGGNEEGMAYGYKITNTGKRKMGYFPFILVDIVEPSSKMNEH